jgi:hypothetical protein
VKPAIRRSVLLSLPVLALALGGCGIQEQTQGWHPRYDGVPADAGDIGLRNVVVVASTDGRATVLTSFANRGGDADELVEVRVGEATATLSETPLEIPARGHASLGLNDNQVELQGVDVTPGHITEVEFHFANAPRITVETLVKEADGRYADVTFAGDENADS